ncbi:MAG: hypothetical protein OEY23_24120, partial [Acidimicrobiia bacterium]|nr:hypothetical protein [Acidimicrobiia bacterium]
HRTLTATLEWSHDLLGPAERTLLHRLAVFRGSFDLAAAEGVCRRPSEEPAVLVDLLDSLCLRSLVVADVSGGRTRYRLLEPVRQFARDVLQACGELDERTDAHAAWYRDLLTRADAGWRAGDDQSWWPVAQTEMANIRAAFEHLVARRRTDEAQRLAVAAYGPIVMHVDFEPEFNWAPRSCDIDPDHVGLWTARARAMAAFGSAKRGDLTRAVERAEAALAALAAGSPDDGLVALSVAVLPIFGGPDIAPAGFLQRARDDALASGDRNRIVWVLTFTNRAREALPHARRLGNLVNLALAMRADNLASAAGERTRGAFLECVDVAERSHSSTMRANASLDLALFDLAHGDASQACAALGHLASAWLRRGDARVWTALGALAVGLETLGDLEGATALAAGTLGRRTLRHPLLSGLGASLAALRRTATGQGERSLAPDLGQTAEAAVATASARLVSLGIK